MMSDEENVRLQFPKPNVFLMFCSRLLKVLWAHVVKAKPLGGGAGVRWDRKSIQTHHHISIFVHVCARVHVYEDLYLVAHFRPDLCGSVRQISNATDYLNPASSITPSHGTERGRSGRGRTGRGRSGRGLMQRWIERETKQKPEIQTQEDKGDRKGTELKGNGVWSIAAPSQSRSRLLLLCVFLSDFLPPVM